VRGGPYAALIALNLDQTDFDCGCDVRQLELKRTLVSELIICQLGRSNRRNAEIKTKGPSVLPEGPHQLTTIELRSYGLSGVLVVGAVVEPFRLSFGGADSDGFDSPSVEVVLPSSGVG
jgi:hypothetical protein